MTMISMNHLRLTIAALAVTGLVCAQEPAGVIGLAAPAAAMPALQLQATGNQTFEYVAGGMFMGSPVKNAPYSGEGVTETTQTLTDGNHIVQKSSAHVYRDSEGRERREQTLPSLGPFTPRDGEPVQTVFIADPIAGVHYSLNSKDHVAMKMPVPALAALPTPLPGGEQGQVNVMIRRGGIAAGVPVPPPPPTPPVPPGGPGIVFFQQEIAGPVTRAFNPAGGSAPKVEQLGSQVMEGVQATGTRTTITIPAGQMGNEKPIDITDERWFSPQLQVTVRSEHNDPRIGKTVYTLQNISLAEPSSTLFQVPADYTVKEPQIEFQKFEQR